MFTSPSLKLYFGNSEAPGLYRTVFHAPGHDYPIIAIRGPVFQSPSLPFIWSTSCISLSLLFVSAVTNAAKGQQLHLPLLEGDHLSPAGALGKLLSKGIRSWLHDIFGSDSTGRPLLNKMILLGNARGRRPGPVTATLRNSYLSEKSIKVFIDDEDVSNNLEALEGLIKNLHAEFVNRKDLRLKRTYKHMSQSPLSCTA